MKKIVTPVVWIILLSCGNNSGAGSNKNDTANLHTLDTIKNGDSAAMKIDNTENKKNEDSLPPMQH